MSDFQGRKATLYRMVMPNHKCPFGLKSLDLLQRKGYVVDDHKLTERADVDAFMKEHDVKTTPQTFINGERIGGYDDLRAHFGMPRQQEKGQTSYRPIMYLFGLAFLMAAAIVMGGAYGGGAGAFLRIFVGVSMCMLALLKFQDLFSFTNRFLGYDLLAQRYVPYATIYPFAEAFAGLGMLFPFATMAAAPVALFIGTIGAYSVFKAVYIEKRDLKCACVGGNVNVPLGFVSLSENLMMMGMGCWILLRFLAF